MKLDKREKDIIWTHIKRELILYHSMKKPRKTSLSFISVIKDNVEELKVQYLGSTRWILFQDYTYDKCLELIIEHRQKTIDNILN